MDGFGGYNMFSLDMLDIVACKERNMPYMVKE